MGRKHGSSFLGTPWPKNLPRKQRPKQALASPTMSLEDAERGQRRKCKRTAAEANLSVQMSLPEKARDRGSAQPSHHRLVAGRTLARLQHLCSMHFLYTPQEFKEEIAARPGITAKLGEQLVYIIGRYGFRHQIRLDVLPMHPSPGIKNRWTCNKSEVQTCNEQELTKIGDTTVRQWQKLKQRRLIALEDRNMKCSDLHLFFCTKTYINKTGESNLYCNVKTCTNSSHFFAHSNDTTKCRRHHMLFFHTHEPTFKLNPGNRSYHYTTPKCFDYAGRI